MANWANVRCLGTARACVMVAVAAAAVSAQQARPAPSRATLLETARRIMEAARYCAVITVDANGRAQARAIDAFAPDESMVVWFATNPRSRKVAELARDPRVTLYYFDATKMGYVTLWGRARLVDDPAEKRMRWKSGWEAFWPDRNAGYLLVEVRPERLEVVSPRDGIEGDPTTWAPPAVQFPLP